MDAPKPSTISTSDHVTLALLLGTLCLLFSYSAAIAQDDMARIQALGIKASDQASKDFKTWQRPQKIHIALPQGQTAQSQALLESLEAVADGIPIVPISMNFNRRPDAKYLPKLEVLIGWCYPALLTQAPKLSWVHSMSVGIDACNRAPGFVESSFILTNNKRGTGPAMAEHGIAMLLSLTRNLHYFRDRQQQHSWKRETGANPMIEIQGKTMLVVGLGGIGTEVARRAAALGMRVIATRNSSRSGPEFVEYVGLADELLDLAKQADVVVNALPLTKQTEGIFNAKFFSQLSKDSYFISLGRGKSTVTQDLIDALEDGTLAGAGLDVTDPEPLPRGHQLWDMRNVIITPHISARTDGIESMRWIVARENLRRYVRGEPLLNLVDKAKGY